MSRKLLVSILSDPNSLSITIIYTKSSSTSEIHSPQSRRRLPSQFLAKVDSSLLIIHSRSGKSRVCELEPVEHPPFSTWVNGIFAPASTAYLVDDSVARKITNRISSARGFTATRLQTSSIIDPPFSYGVEWHDLSNYSTFNLSSPRDRFFGEDSFFIGKDETR